jgi:hypothetical protein
VGLATSGLSDLDGPVGVGARSLLSPSAEPRGDRVIGLEVIAQTKGRDMFIDCAASSSELHRVVVCSCSAALAAHRKIEVG